MFTYQDGVVLAQASKWCVPIQSWRDCSEARSLNDSLYRQMIYATTMGSGYGDTYHLKHDIHQQKMQKGGNAI